jgi:uncharacterized membrane protein (DUF485 family)
MSPQQPPPIPGAPLTPAAALRPASAPGRLLMRVGDRLNPILVKETRQALKSRQFTLTFGLLLVAVWVWTIVGVAMIGPTLWYGAEGRKMFYGYYLVMALPLLVIVPYGALRALASEHEEHTYDLLSITTLGPRQIVGGKLGSSILQMMIYLSAISPCLAFTYMLRGIDVPTIFVILCATTLASLGLAVVGLLVGALSTAKHWQVALSVLAVLGLALVFFMACGFTSEALSADMPLSSAAFWQIFAAVVSIAASYIVLAFFAAAARVTFQSENRSTPLRIVMFLQQLLAAAWMGFAALKGTGPELLMVFVCLVGLHWYLMGLFMTGESPELSSRVKRHLPQSLLGRALSTWFNPGPGTGYLFAVANCAAMFALALAGAALLARFNYSSAPKGAKPLWTFDEVSRIGWFAVLGLGYLVLYLGVGLLVLRWLRRFARQGAMLSVVVHGLLFNLCVTAPYLIAEIRSQGLGANYSFLQITNAWWSLQEINKYMLTSDRAALAVLVWVLALPVLLANLPGVAREVRQVRMEPPRRVAEEDAAAAARRAPPKPLHTSPWD